MVPQAAESAADRVQAIRDVARLEDELGRAHMPTTEVSVLHGMRTLAPDEGKISLLTDQLAAAREAVEVADERTSKALKASHRIRA